MHLKRDMGNLMAMRMFGIGLLEYLGRKNIPKLYVNRVLRCQRVRKKKGNIAQGFRAHVCARTELQNRGKSDATRTEG